MALLVRLQNEVVTSLKNGDAIRVATLRYLLAAIRNEAIAKYGALGESALSDSDVLDVIKRQVKTHRESIAAFQKAGRTDLVRKEEAELVILQSFLPRQLTDDELKNILESLVAADETNFGLLMKQAMRLVAGRADGGKVAVVLKQMLSESGRNKYQ